MQPQSPRLVELQRTLNRINKDIVRINYDYKQLGLKYHLAPIQGRAAVSQEWPEELRDAWTSHQTWFPVVLFAIRDLGGWAKCMQVAIKHKDVQLAEQLLERTEDALLVAWRDNENLHTYSVRLSALDDDNAEQVNEDHAQHLEHAVEQEGECVYDVRGRMELNPRRPHFEFYIDPVADALDAVPDFEEPAAKDLIIEETTISPRHRLAKIGKMSPEQYRQFVSWVMELPEFCHAFKHGIFPTDAQGIVAADKVVEYVFGKFQHVRLQIYCDCDHGKWEEPAAPYHAEDGQAEAERTFGVGAAVRFL